MQNSLYVCVFLYLNVAHAFAETGRDPCQEYDTSILVSGESSDLFLCLKGRSVENYTVSFGKKGLGKSKPGDQKTPVGRFKLGRPRPSRSSFKTFIPIQVPKRIGSAVGIHGPSRSGRWFGPLSVAVDWTAGGIAMSSDAAISEVSSFVRRHRVKWIHILPPSDWPQEILKAQGVRLRSGDIIFQTSKTKVAATVFGTTGSIITHVGMVVMRAGKPYVIEAVGPVKLTPFDTFVRRGIGEYFTLKRLKSNLDRRKRLALVRRAKKFLGRRYDRQFRWSDGKQYCSELVYKTYKNGLGIELGRLDTIGSLYSSWNPITRLYVSRVYKRSRPDPKEPIITPQAIYDSPTWTP